MGKLFVVGTPIGNLEDISARGIKTLEEVDFIAAEDTRVSLKLLSRYGIKKPMVSYYEHNARERGEQILQRILAGENGAVITDAGMPCISDPGEDLVALCAENGVEVVVVPGPSAAISALAISGLATRRFAFEGFLDPKKNARKKQLEEIKEDRHTLIFYEAPHKLLATLEDMLAVLGNRKISLARELTKTFEEVVRTDLQGAIEHFTATTPKGEFVLIVEGAAEQRAEIPLEEAVKQVKLLQEEGLSAAEAAKTISRQTGIKKGDLYKASLQ